MQRTMMAAAIALGVFATTTTQAQTGIEHAPPSYFVAGKRLTVEARISDPKGVKVARTYFRAGAQADYTFVPMQYTTGSRFVGTLPAPAAGTPSVEYVLLAQNNDGSVYRTQAYKIAARESGDTPSWQSDATRGDIKVFTEATNAPRTIAGFSDSITLDIVESGARLGAAAGLVASSSAGAGSAAGATTSDSPSTATAASGTATTGTAAGATAATATVGGLSTAAIIGGVAIAGVAAAAASSSSGGGSSSTGGTPTTGSPFAGSWSGTTGGPSTATCTSGGVSATSTCTSNEPWTGTVAANGTFTVTVGPGTDTCTTTTGTTVVTLAPQTFTFTVATNGVVTVPAQTTTNAGITETCPAWTMTFTTSPRRVSGQSSCTTSGSPTPGSSCSGNGSTTFTGS
jgi:hypothetical protein